MFIMPDQDIMQPAIQIMEKALQDLYKVIDSKDHGNNPKKAMAAIKLFAIETMFRLSAKAETLSPGFGEQLVEGVRGIGYFIKQEKIKLPQEPTPKNILFSEQDDLSNAIFLLSSSIINQIEICFEELPPILRNDEVLLCSLAAIVAKIFSRCGYANLNSFIDDFSKNVCTFADAVEDDVAEKICH